MNVEAVVQVDGHRVAGRDAQNRPRGLEVAALHSLIGVTPHEDAVAIRSLDVARGRNQVELGAAGGADHSTFRRRWRLPGRTDGQQKGGQADDGESEAQPRSPPRDGVGICGHGHAGG